ncbi:hypothetical protein HY844_01975 [Candidatus Berkelbacteria bacterium]|nr:hypothetical protein [Candidatus Berkelbacteria bacterium]
MKNISIGNKVIFKSILLSALIAVAVFSISSGKKLLPQSASAQTSTQAYTSTWKAQELIVARLKSVGTDSSKAECEAKNQSYGAFPNPDNSEAVIGIASWEVKGSVDGGQAFKEKWTVPSTMPQYYGYTPGVWTPVKVGGLIIGYLCTGGSQIKVVPQEYNTDWVYGYLNNNSLIRSAIEFRKEPVGGTFTNSHVDPDRVSSFGLGTSCQDTNRCIFSTGSYGFNTWHEFEEAGNGKILNAGILMPLKWVVTGTLCESKTDASCN